MIRTYWLAFTLGLAGFVISMAMLPVMGRTIGSAHATLHVVPALEWMAINQSLKTAVVGGLLGIAITYGIHRTRRGLR